MDTAIRLDYRDNISDISIINTYGEILKAAPKMVEYWYNTFWNPSTRTTTTEEQKRDKVKVE